MDPQDEADGLEPDGDEALWRVLGHARPVEVSPYFARRVLRDLKAGDTAAERAPSGGWRAWLRPRWVLTGTTAAVCALILGLVSFSSQPVVGPRFVLAPRQAASPMPLFGRPAVSPAAGARIGGEEDVSPQDVDVIADLDNLVAREETNEWTDDSSRF